MLVLAAKVNQRAHALGKLTHAGQAAVDARARATVGTQAARHHEALLVMWARKQTALHQRAFAPLSNRGGVGTLPHEQLECGEQRGFPAPVSPVSTVRPAPGTRSASRIKATFSTWISSIMTHSVEHTAHRAVKALRTIIEQQNIGVTPTNLHTVDLALAGEELAVDGDGGHRGAVLGHLEFDHIGGRGEEGARLNSVRRDRHADHARVIGADDGASCGKRIARRAGGRGHHHAVAT